MKGSLKLFVEEDTKETGRSHRNNICSERASSSYKGRVSCNT